MRSATLIAAAALAFLLAPGAEAAGPVNTSVELKSFAPDSGTLYAYGTVSSPERRCVAGREIEIYLLSSDAGPVYLDTARSADRGGWMGLYKAKSLPNHQYNAIRLVALKQSVRAGKGKKITCAGKTKTYSLAG